MRVMHNSNKQAQPLDCVEDGNDLLSDVMSSNNNGQRSFRRVLDIVSGDE